VRDSIDVADAMPLSPILIRSLVPPPTKSRFRQVRSRARARVEILSAPLYLGSPLAMIDEWKSPKFAATTPTRA